MKYLNKTKFFCHVMTFKITGLSLVTFYFGGPCTNLSKVMSVCDLVSAPKLLDRYLFKFGTSVVHQKLSCSSDLQPYWPIIKYILFKALNELFMHIVNCYIRFYKQTLGNLINCKVCHCECCVHHYGICMTNLVYVCLVS
jgi:hypothetical protein